MNSSKGNKSCFIMTEKVAILLKYLEKSFLKLALLQKSNKALTLQRGQQWMKQEYTPRYH